MTKIMLGDCLDQLKELDDNSIDSIVTDPPYGLSFMGKAWDYDVPTTEIWKECLRVLKPGGHLLAFGGTRTYHRLVVNIEDAGFEIRDQIMWIYGSGFPKSQNIALAIDKQLGVESVSLGANPNKRAAHKQGGAGFDKDVGGEALEEMTLKAPGSVEGQKWSGWGTALKPANEPICLARKPLSEKTVAKNVLKHGVGGLNIEASRIEGAPRTTHKDGNFTGAKSKIGDSTAGLYELGTKVAEVAVPDGRFPANILFDEAAAAVLDEQVKITMPNMHGAGNKKTGKGETIGDKSMFGLGYNQPSKTYDGSGEDSSRASRFFYVAKASKKDRGEGNIHPTVKPIKLMEYLVKLVTPEGGVVLDPFMGSGTTGVAALGLGFKFVGVERDEKYYEISEGRIRDTLAARKLARLALNKTKEVS